MSDVREMDGVRGIFQILWDGLFFFLLAAAKAIAMI
jgi:hypothetical protein